MPVNIENTTLECIGNLAANLEKALTNLHPKCWTKIEVRCPEGVPFLSFVVYYEDFFTKKTNKFVSSIILLSLPIEHLPYLLKKFIQEITPRLKASYEQPRP